MSIIENLTTYQLDVLKEVGNIGAGNAATALSRLLKTKVEMSTPSVRVISFEDTLELVGGPEELIVSIFLRIQGDVPGSMFFILPPHQAEKFVHQITDDMSFSLSENGLDEIELSVLQETGNILSGSYLSALADLTQLNMQPTVPSLNMDMAGAILAEGLMEVSTVGDYAIIIDTMIEEKSADNYLIQGHFFLLPDSTSFSTLFSALGADEL